MNKEEIDKILNWLEKVDRKNLPFNAEAIGWGPKISNGVETGEYSLIFSVKEKKDLKDLSLDEIVPKYFNLEESSFRTDVQVTQLCKPFIVDCHSISNTVQPVQTNRTKLRPLIGGSESIISWGQYVATLGAFVIDKTDGQVVALSNSHVYGASQLIASLTALNDANSANTVFLSGYQPTGYWRTTPEQDYIGKCKRSVPIGNVDDSPIISSCDAAILELKDYNLINPQTSLNIINFSQPGPYKFATEEEITSLVNPLSPNFGAPIFRSGRTCGPVGFPGYTNSCGLSVYSIQDMVVGLYSQQYSLFPNSLLVRGNTVSGRGGDSGSAYFALLSSNIPTLSTWKMIGLLFAGPDEEFPSFSVGCKITTITNDLKIASWNGQIPTLSANTEYVRTNDFNLSTIELSGRKFYQLGRT